MTGGTWKPRCCRLRSPSGIWAAGSPRARYTDALLTPRALARLLPSYSTLARVRRAVRGLSGVHTVGRPQTRPRASMLHREGQLRPVVGTADQPLLVLDGTPVA